MGEILRAASKQAAAARCLNSRAWSNKYFASMAMNYLCESLLSRSRAEDIKISAKKSIILEAGFSTIVIFFHPSAVNCCL
jgi:hypothetical protein